MAVSIKPLIVVEDDSFLRLIQLVLDPTAPRELFEAFAHFCAHDVPDFRGWCEQASARVRHLYPADVRLVRDCGELLANIPGANALVVEALPAGAHEIAAAGGTLRLVQRYGTLTRNIDEAACRRAGIKIKTLRRRANISTAEQALALMLALARQLNQNANLISIEQIEAAGYTPTQYDRARTPNGNWARVTGLKTLFARQLGIIGLGEIGRELALRAAALGMRITYHQRHRLTSAEEQHYQASYSSRTQLLETSDCVSLHLPRGAETRGIIGRAELENIKPGALLINVSQPSLIDRAALLDALESGRLGGFAMDNFYEEPGDPDDPLIKFRNVIITPHLAGSPRSNSLDDIAELLDNLANGLS
ncbi:MAG TPA: NAD(P)-dependent oxidoreductase [Candidatus Binatia bacterium]|jgi:phosphoglycerate dehydrogenase-like enzyme